MTERVGERGRGEGGEREREGGGGEISGMLCIQGKWGYCAHAWKQFFSAEYHISLFI